MFASEPAPPQDAPGIIEATLRYRQLTVALTLAGLLLGAVFTVAQGESNRAEGHLVLTDPRGSATFREGASVVDFGRYINERMDFAMSGDVLEAAATAFPDAGTTEDIRRKCDISGTDSSSVLDIACTYSDDKTAVGTVDALAQAYRSATKAQADANAEAALDALDAERAALESSLERALASPSDFADAVYQSTAERLTQIETKSTDIRTTQALFGDGTESYDYARVIPTSSATFKLMRNSLIGALLGFLSAILIAWFRADRSPIGESGTEVSSWLGLPMLGEVEHHLLAGDTIDLMGTPESAFQRLASNLDAVLTGRSVLFTPAEPIARHEDLVIKTALVAARAGKRVLLIDSDQTNRAVSQLLGLPTGAGLAEYIAGDATAEQSTVRVSFGKSAGLGASSLFLMGPGGEPGQTPALFRSADTTRALAALESTYDLIIIDGPPLLASAGSAVIGQAVDGVVIMIERGTPRTTIEEARRQLAFLSSDALGAVFVHGA